MLRVKTVAFTKVHQGTRRRQSVGPGTAFEKHIPGEIVFVDFTIKSSRGGVQLRGGAGASITDCFWLQEHFFFKGRVLVSFETFPPLPLEPRSASHKT